MCVGGTCVSFEEKQVLMSSTPFAPVGGIPAADAHCATEFGDSASTWKALLVGGGRVASATPFTGDGQVDWVLAPYTKYYNWEGRLMWTTDDVALFGVAYGQRVQLDQPAWGNGSPATYPWSGYADDWTTIEDETCNGWRSNSGADRGAFAFDDLTYAEVEPCSFNQPLMCVEQ